MTTTASTQTPANNEAQQLRRFQEETVNLVLSQVNELKESGGIDLPEDYSPGNALKAAWFVLLQAKDMNKKPVLEVCSKVSIANALLRMVTEGLNPAKKQCSFIAYGGVLEMQREYFGSIALAKRYNPNIVDVTANVIYNNDVFIYKIDPVSGRKTVIEHSQVLENIDITKIRGAYATIIFADGSSVTEPMTMAQIRNSWNQGATNGNSPAHKNFTDEMAKKTAINRICKPFINTSDDSELVTVNPVSAPASANSQTLDIESEDVSKEQVSPLPSKEVKAQPTAEPSQEIKPNVLFQEQAEMKAEPSFV